MGSLQRRIVGGNVALLGGEHLMRKGEYEEKKRTEEKSIWFAFKCCHIATVSF